MTARVFLSSVWVSVLGGGLSDLVFFHSSLEKEKKGHSISRGDCWCLCWSSRLGVIIPSRYIRSGGWLVGRLAVVFSFLSSLSLYLCVVYMLCSMYVLQLLFLFSHILFPSLSYLPFVPFFPGLVFLWRAESVLVWFFFLSLSLDGLSCLAFFVGPVLDSVYILLLLFFFLLLYFGFFCMESAAYVCVCVCISFIQLFKHAFGSWVVVRGSWWGGGVGMSLCDTAGCRVV